MSTSRLEKFIYAICSMEVSDLPAPLSRIEILWNCLITGETPDFEPQSRNEKYLMAMLGLYELENLPAPMSRGEKLLYKIAMGETDLSDIPAYLSRYEELLGYLAENGGVGDFEYILQTLNQRLSTLYSTKERPMKQAVIKGDTLVNELPRPSLKNTMTNVGSQKLNQGYDSINVVDGEFKSAILKGQTLVNLANIIGYKTDFPKWRQIWLENTLTPNTKYFIKMYGKPTNAQVVLTHTSDLNNDGSNLTQYTTSETYIFTTPATMDTYLKLHINDGGVSEIITVEQLEKVGVLIVKYQDEMENQDIPYFEGMQSVKMPVLTTTGKNLLDGKNMFIGYINSDGTLIADSTSNSLSDYIKVEPSTSYAYKCFIENQTAIYGEFAFFDENKKYIDVIYNHHDSNTCIITPDNCHYLRVWNNQYTNNGDSHPNAMLVKTTNLPSTLIYEPYRSNTLTLAEPVNLRKVGDVEDEFDALTGQVTERVGEIVFDGSENWAEASEGDNINGFSIWISIGGVEHGDFAICDKLPFYPYNNDLANKTQFISFPSNGSVFIINVKGSTSVEETKGWLSQNPITVQYKLATPTTKQVSTTITNQDGATQTTLHSFNDGHLSVSSQGLLPSAVNYEVPTNNSYYLPDMLTLGAQYTSRGSADCNATIDGKLLALGTNKTFTTPSSVTDRLMVLDAPVDDLMFIKGDQTAKDFGYFEGMKSVEMSGIQVTGKNLFDPKLFESKRYIRGENTPLKDALYCCYDTPIEANVGDVFGWSTNTISYKVIIEFDENGNQIEYSSENVKVKIYTVINSSTKYIKVQTNNAVSSYLSQNPMLEKGSVATPYEPYKSTTLTLNEPVTLRKVGDVQDTLDGLTGEVTERVGEVVADGVNLKFMNVSSNENEYGDGSVRFDLEALDDIIVKAHDYWVNPSNILINNRLKTGHFTDFSARKEKDFITLWNKHLVITFSDMNITAIEQANDWLKQNPITIQYQLATESTKTIDLTTIDQDGQPTKLKTFNDISYVEINSDNMIPSVNVEIATKISETLATLDPQQLNISETQNELGQTIDEQSENTDATMMATTEIYEQTL